MSSGVFVSFLFFNSNFFVLSFGVNHFYFLFLVLFVSMVIIVYSKYYMSGEINVHSYFIWMVCFLMSMLTLICSFSFASLLLSWEFLGISSFFLIFYNNTWEAQMNSLVTMMTMRVGDFFLFFVLSTTIMMSFMNLSLVYFTNISYLFIIIFLSTKSAQFPFSGWLPKAMSAPTPTSALVHSSTLVTAGLIVLMIFSEMMMIPLMLSILVTIGAFTMLMGSVMSFMESSVKKVVAFSTLSQMGLATIVFGLGNFHVGLINLISHGFAKSLLFMQVGYLIHIMNLQQNTRVWGSAWVVEGFMKMQISTTLFSLCGMMFLGGMVTKESLIELMISNSLLVLFLVFLLLSIYLTFVYSILLYKCLFNNSGGPVISFHGSVIMMVVTFVEIFAVICFISWIFMNSLSLENSFVGLEVFIPVLFMLIMVFSSPMIINHLMTFFSVNSGFALMSSQSIFKWASFIFPVKFFETFLNSLNFMVFMMMSKVSSKTVFSLSFSHLVFFMMIMMILL